MTCMSSITTIDGRRTQLSLSVCLSVYIVSDTPRCRYCSDTWRTTMVSSDINNRPTDYQ